MGNVEFMHDFLGHSVGVLQCFPRRHPWCSDRKWLKHSSQISQDLLYVSPLSCATLKPIFISARSDPVRCIHDGEIKFLPFLSTNPTSFRRVVSENTSPLPSFCRDLPLWHDLHRLCLPCLWQHHRDRAEDQSDEQPPACLLWPADVLQLWSVPSGVERTSKVVSPGQDPLLSWAEAHPSLPHLYCRYGNLIHMFLTASDKVPLSFHGIFFPPSLGGTCFIFK